jgi:cytochrome c oxidase subunit I+III
MQPADWPPGGISPPDLLLPTLSSGLLLLSGIPMYFAERSARSGALYRIRYLLPIALLMAAGYLAMKAIEHMQMDYSWTSHAYGSMVWTISGYSAFHVLGLLVMGAVIWAIHHYGHLRGRRVAAVEAVGVYWYFVSLSSVPVWATLYVAPYLI